MTANGWLRGGGPAVADIRLRVAGLTGPFCELIGVSTTSITVRVPLSIRRRPGRKTVVTPVGAANTVQTRADPALLGALARAFRWQKMLDDGRYGSISEMAAAEKIERGYLGKPLRLTLLAPAVMEAIVEGREGVGVGLLGLMEGIGGLSDR